MKSWMFEKLNTIAVITLLLAFLSSCSPESTYQSSYQPENIDSNSSSQIIGGLNANLEYQKQHGIVGLSIMVKDQFGRQSTATCTGTLITRNIVMTAAHCLAEEGITAIGVMFTTDESKLTEETIRFAIAGTIHPEYLKGVDPTSTTNDVAWNDIAIIKLSADAPVDFKLAQLPKSMTEVNLVSKSKLTLAGFGITNAVVRRLVRDTAGNQSMLEVPSQGSGLLRKVDGILVKNMSVDKKEIFLDQTKLKGACHGDSGGPAFLVSKSGSLQVGVTSRGTNKLGNCNEMAIYTNVAAHLDWITSASAALNDTAQTPVTAQAK